MNKNTKAAGADIQVPSQAQKINYWTSLMPRIGFGLMLLGIILSACFAHDFKDTNLGLMIGFGFIIGGIQVLLLGSLFHALQPSFAKERQKLHGEQQPERV
ncbi:hypothetical protein [Paenibacillus sp. OV219]|uniref:hypothetical protein n=1 Tax=Paenibacillus sp. OV219 TaxID=1884377 RepID=UPI0008AF1C12|nr:hypothetical protein [Paenibacillus sp. OV219]SEN99266.1 hypothetical protein SAMN05518847_105188 [Paenibacillus sp. OV219]